MFLLRSQETVHGGTTSSNVANRTAAGDRSVREAIRQVRGEHYWSAYLDLIGLLEDVEDATTLDIRPLIRARILLESLPNGFPPPEIGIDPDGEVAFDWIRSNRTLVSVSIGVTDDLSFAAMFEDGTAHGVIRLVDVFPPALIDMLQRLYRSE